MELFMGKLRGRCVYGASALYKLHWALTVGVTIVIAAFRLSSAVCRIHDDCFGAGNQSSIDLAEQFVVLPLEFCNSDR